VINNFHLKQDEEDKIFVIGYLIVGRYFSINFVELNQLNIVGWNEILI
jgi:hypothetical protein